MQTKLLINGQFVQGEGAAISVLNPATGAEICQVNEASIAQIEAAASAAAAAFKTYKKTTPNERAGMLLALADAINANATEFAELESQNCGKPYLAAINDEMPAVADVFRFFAGAIRTMTGPLAGEYLPGHTSMIRRDPLGVVASIAPWNYPLMMAAWKLGPALAAGNTVILKPSEMTPLTTLKLGELINEIFPKGVVNILNGRGEIVGAPMISQPQVQMISITGDISTGQKIMETAAKSVKRTHLELGGKAPAIVFDDADLDAAVDGAIGSKYRNAGQTCVCANRIFVQESVYEAFLEKFTAAVLKQKVGPGTEQGVSIGPLINAEALEKVQRLVGDATGKGARVLTGGHALEGTFYAPTVLADISPNMDILQEEIFGPVAPVIRFSTENEAIVMANDTPYGLAAYFYGRDVGRVFRVAEALDYGMIGVNTGLIATTVAPFGGMKESGIGREGSKYGLEEFLETKYVCLAV